MAWNGSGTYVRSNGTYTGATTWATDQANGYNIESARHDTHDQDLATGLNNCLTKDGQNSPTANLPMGGFIHTGVGTGSARNHYPSIGQVQDSTPLYGGTSSGAANTYAITLTPAITAYAAGQRFFFLSHQANTSAATLNVNGLGAKNIRKYDGATALAANDILNSRIVSVIYDGTQFQLENPLERSLVNFGEGQATGVVSTTSTVLIGLTTAAFTFSVAANERVVLQANGAASHSNVNGKIDFRLLRDSTQLGVFSSVEAFVAATTGEGLSWGLNYSEIPGAGTYTYAVHWSTPSGTAYASSRRIQGYVLRVT